MNNKYKLAYMGTPEFAAVPLKGLIEAGYNIPLVVTMPDRARGRGKEMSPTPVKIVAEAHGINVLQPEGKKDFYIVMEELKKSGVDLVIVAAYGHILPKEMLELPPLGCINIHASLLPRHRGAAPIQSAIMAGDEETGVSLMYMTEEMDAGDIIAMAKIPMEEKTAGDLFDELAILGKDLLLDRLPSILNRENEALAQDPTYVTYSSKIKKADSIIDFSKSAREISNLIRAMSPSPGARTYLGEKMLIITEAKVMEDGTKSKNEAESFGRIEKVDTSGIAVHTGQGMLLITKLKPVGKQSMKVSEYIKGNKIEIGENLG